MDELIPHSPQDLFARDAFEACMLVSAVRNTRRAYWNDAQKWIAFCKHKRIDPYKAQPIAVAAWVEALRQEETVSKTRLRRLSALSSVYTHLRRNGKVKGNPFSPTEGPKRESSVAMRPTPMVEVATAKRALERCEQGTDYEDIRDAAILRVLWATGARKVSVVQITRERLQRVTDAKALTYTCNVPGKGNAPVRLWLNGKTAKALQLLFTALDAQGIKDGPIFRMGTRRPMDEALHAQVGRAASLRGDARS